MSPKDERKSLFNRGMLFDRTRIIGSTHSGTSYLVVVSVAVLDDDVQSSQSQT